MEEHRGISKLDAGLLDRCDHAADGLIGHRQHLGPLDLIRLATPRGEVGERATDVDGDPPDSCHTGEARTGFFMEPMPSTEVSTTSPS